MVLVILKSFYITAPRRERWLTPAARTRTHTPLFFVVLIPLRPLCGARAVAEDAAYASASRSGGISLPRSCHCAHAPSYFSLDLIGIQLAGQRLEAWIEDAVG